jgi:hypothetical protein
LAGPGWLARLDRRWIFLATGLLVLLPLVRPLLLPLSVTPPTRDYFRAVERLPEGSAVLMSCDYDPGTLPEMVPMTKSTLRHLFRKQCKVVVTVLWNGGPGVVNRALREVAEDEFHLRYGEDYVNLGYKAGNEGVMVLMGQGFANAFPTDYHGNRSADLPLLQRARDYSGIALVVSLGAGYPGTKEWVQQVQARFHVDMVSGCTAVAAPEYYPYLQSGQLEGLLGGMAGAAEYEALLGRPGPATRGMDAQSLAHLFVALCIVAGNLAHWGPRRQRG